MMQYVEQGDREFLEELKSKGKEGQKFEPPPGMTFTVGEMKVEGDTATVMVTGTKDGKEETQQFKLIKQDGEWKIDLIPDEAKKMLENMDKMMRGMGDAMKNLEEGGNP
jgi:hypothetical protein